MPANLTPQYKEAERRYREAKSHQEKLEALREMMALLPKHKGTDKLQADLRQRISKLEDEALHPKPGGAHHLDPGHVRREGAGQWVLIGGPNSGKSALLHALTHAHPEVAAYPFTTRAPLPGMMPFEDLQVQLVDTPAVTAQHVEPYMPNLVRAADGVVWVGDVTANNLEASAAALDSLLERARVLPASKPLPPGAPPFLMRHPVLAVANKVDLDSDGRLVKRAREQLGMDLPFFAVSAERGTGLDDLKRALFVELRRIRIYAKEPGKKPDLARPFVLHNGATVYDLALLVHKDVAAQLKYARLWGSARFESQQVDREHVLNDRDVVELHT